MQGAAYDLISATSEIEGTLKTGSFSREKGHMSTYAYVN